MASFRRLSEEAGEHLISALRGPDVCVDCFNLTRGFERCFACASGEQHLAVVVPISYSVAGEHLHTALAAYKRDADPYVPQATAQLAAILWRFLECHERCVAAAAGVDRFELVTSVPSSDAIRDECHPLRRIVGELVGRTRGRHERLLSRTDVEVRARRFDPARYQATRLLAGERILLIDDTWTSGASAQSAAATLLEAGAERVAAVVIGRHLNPCWHENDRRLRPLRQRFDFSRCVLCAPSGTALRAA